MKIYKLKDKIFSIFTLIFLFINTTISFSNTVNINNFKVWENKTENYSCVKYRDEESCHDVDDYETEEKCTTIDGEEECRDVDDYEDRQSCTPKTRQECTTSESTTRKGSCNGYESVKKCTTGPSHTEEYDCKTTPGTCESYETITVKGSCREVCVESYPSWHPSHNSGECKRAKRVCESDTTKRVCSKMGSSKRSCNTRTIPGEKTCKTVRGACNSWETIVVPGENTCRTVNDGESCTTTRVKVGSHRECNKGESKQECKSVRVKSGSHEECSTNSVSYWGTCTRDSSDWNSITNEEDINIINTLNSYAIVYKGDTLKIEDIIKTFNQYNINIIRQPNTNVLGEQEYEITAFYNGNLRKIKGVAMVIDKPSLNYKQIRTTTINKTVLANEIYEEIIPSNDLVEVSRYEVYIDGIVDTNTIGVKPVNLKVVDIIKNKEFIGYISDVRVQEEMKPIIFKNNIEAYVGDTLEKNDIVEDENIPDDYIVSILEQPNKPKDFIKIQVKSSAGSVWQVNVPAKILKKPILEYKAIEETTKETSYNYIASDIVERVIADNKVNSDRYTYTLDNKIDTSTIGDKEAIFSIQDTILDREFKGYSHIVRVIEKMKEINFNDVEKYIGDIINISDIINNTKEHGYIYNILDNNNVVEGIELNSIGDNVLVNIKVENPITGSIWNIKRSIKVLPKPKLIYENLWIYQNSKEKDKKAKDFINLMKVDLNEKYPGRYKIVFIEAGDISNLGNSEFRYLITDTITNRNFEVLANIDVRDEIITPKLHSGVIYSLGEKPNIDDLISNIDKDKYDIVITNLDDLDLYKEGVKTLNIKIISKETGKEFNYKVKIEYKVVYVNLGILKWNLGKILNLDRIKEIKKLEEYYKLELIKPSKLRYEILEEYDVEMKLFIKNGGYKIGQLKVIVVENKMLDDIDKIITDDKVQLVNNLTDISNKIEDRLLNSNNKGKYNNLWIQQNNLYNKTIGNSNSNLKFGMKLGYDRLLNRNIILGAYLGYDNKVHKLTDKSNEHLIHASIYSGYNINKKIYIGGLAQYTNIFGIVNIKDINNEKNTFNRISHNISGNIFLGMKKEFDKGINLSGKIGNSLLFDIKDTMINKYDKLEVKPNIANELYATIKVNKYLFDNKINIYTELKGGVFTTSHTIKFNNIEKKYTNKNKIMGTFRINSGIDYRINNFNIGASLGVGTNTKKNININGKLNLSYIFGRNKKEKVIKKEKEIINPILNQDRVYLVGEIPKEDDLVSNIDKEKYIISIINLEDININEIGDKEVEILIKSKLSGKEYRYKVILKYIERESGKLIVNFDFDSYKLSYENKKKISEFLINKDIIEIVITGHTDKKGGIKYNQKLSEKRAKVVYEYIMSILKYDLKIKYFGKGKLEPISEYDKENRRTEIKIFY